jgi:5-methylcytosine-specific restriction endonuclease McrA
MRPIRPPHIQSKGSRQQAADRARAVGAAINASDATRVRDVLDALRFDDIRRRKSARRKVRDAYGSRPMCVYCGSGAGTADHVVPRAKGGGHRLGNLVPACRPCNERKRDMEPAEFFRRYPKAAQAFVERAEHADPELHAAAWAVVNRIDSASQLG